jgi:hypothetical protein
MTRPLTLAELEAGLETIRRSPADHGTLDLIVRRPAIGGRESVREARLDLEDGLIGDNWKARGSSRTPDGAADPEAQINVMNARVIALVAGAPERWPLAGDQLYLDLDLSGENLPAGTRLAIGEAVIEVTAKPHTGCAKFVSRFGRDAAQFVNSEIGRRLCLRGINAKVVRPGMVRVRDIVRKTT